jgi:membrane protein
MAFASAGWSLLKETGSNFIDDNALSRGASIAYYTLFSIAPVLLIIVAIAGLVFGREAAQGAIVRQLSGLMGSQTAEALQQMLKSADRGSANVWVAVIGVATLILTASGVFGEVQSALNAIWSAKSRASTVSRLVRARLASLGLVVTCGFLLIVSLAVSAVLEALSKFLRASFEGAEVLVGVFDFVFSTALITVLFAVIFKVLPDTEVRWRDALRGALVTTLLFEGGKYLIALYIGESNVASTFGAAGALIVLLLWIYYTAQIFLIGAEFTHALASRREQAVHGQERRRRDRPLSSPATAR